MLVERLEIGVFSVEMYRNKLLIITGDDKSVILAQNLCA